MYWRGQPLVQVQDGALILAGDIRRRDQHCKLVTAKARRGKKAGLHQAPGNLLQNFVADQMPILIVQRLEAIEIDESQNRRHPGARLVRHQIHKGAPVLKPGKRVFRRKARRFCHQRSYGFPRHETAISAGAEITHQRPERDDRHNFVFALKFCIEGRPGNHDRGADYRWQARNQCLEPALVVEQGYVNQDAE